MASAEEIAKRLVEAGRARDLHDLLTGVSPYSRTDTKGAREANGADWPDDPELTTRHRLWTFTIHHLDFVARYGRDRGEIWDGAILHCAYPEEFDAWLRAGTPGLSPQALAAYLQDHPLEGDESIRPPGSDTPAANVAPR